MSITRFIRTKQDADQCWTQVTQLVTYFIKLHCSDFSPIAMQGVLRLLRKAASFLPKNAENIERLKRISTCQIWMTRCTRKKTLRRILEQLSDDQVEEVTTSNVTWEQEALGLLAAPADTEEDREERKRKFFATLLLSPSSSQGSVRTEDSSTSLTLALTN